MAASMPGASAWTGVLADVPNALLPLEVPGTIIVGAVAALSRRDGRQHSAAAEVG
jgi:hypothetical protein